MSLLTIKYRPGRHFDPKKALLKCDNPACGQVFSKLHSQRQGDHDYCSRKCFHAAAKSK